MKIIQMQYTLNLNENGNVSSFSFTYLENSKKYTIENPNESSADIKIENESAKVEKVDDSNLKITYKDSINLKRISEDEYNKTKDTVNKIIPVAKSKFGNYLYFVGIKDIDGKTYYAYGYSDGDMGSAVYFDENGDLYNGKPQSTTGDSNSTNSSKELTYETYTNSRYGFSIDHPTNLIAGTQPTNGDGLEFKNSDGTVSLTASGSNNVLNETAESLYNKDLSNLKIAPGYKNLLKIRMQFHGKKMV